MSKVRLFILLLLVVFAAFPVFAQDEEAPPTVSVGESDMGPVLIGPTGFTLYLFTRDAMDVSNCYERCAEQWPPLLAAEGAELTMGEGVPGELGLIARTTGTFQVTYNGMPLYYWWRDWAPGQTTGHGVGEVWYVIPPATVYQAASEEHGAILVGANGMTVYSFANDADGMSACYDDCATNWPPVLVESADALMAGAGASGELGTTERTDGTLQVTYNGMPLYYFAADEARGDATGHNRGDVWFVVAP